ncbi:hypothetical protein BDF21DRAFT_405600 [Thamnidium elegans]|nr:hypothetical protein BDF21DRAFT_405600 [Thamnidium elegans]
MEQSELNSNDIIRIVYTDKISRPGFCIGDGYSVFTKNETMICGLKNINMVNDCLKYENGTLGYHVDNTLILPCAVILMQDRIVMDSLPITSGSNYQSPNFSILFISMIALFIFYLKR